MLASFAAAAVGLFPMLLMALHEVNAEPAGIVSLADMDDAAIRSAGMALSAVPFLYLIAVPACYAVGTLFVKLRLRTLWNFVAGALALACVLGTGIGTVIADPSRFGFKDLLASIAISSLLLLVAALPAAICWWLLAGRLHNLLLQRTATPPAERER